MTLGGFKLVWLLVLLTPVISVAIALRTREAYKASPGAGGPVPRRSFISREALGPGVSMALVSAGFAAMASFVVLHMNDEGVSGGAWVFTAFAASLVLSRIVAGGLPPVVLYYTADHYRTFKKINR